MSCREATPDTICVGIPAYNAEPFLERAVRSVRSQTVGPLDILVVDDGSSDRTAQIARDLGCRLVVHETNRGDPGARNTVLREAGRCYIAWLDADDEWLPGHLESLIALHRAHPESAVLFGLARYAEIERDWLAPGDLSDSRGVLRAALQRCFVPHNAVMTRRDSQLAVGGYDVSLRVACDFDMWCRLALRERFACTGESTVLIHQHPAQSSRGAFRYAAAEYNLRRAYLQLPDRLGLDPHDRPWLRAVNRTVWKGHVISAWHSRDAVALRYHISERTGHGTSAVDVAEVYWRTVLLPVAQLRDRLRSRGRQV